MKELTKGFINEVVSEIKNMVPSNAKVECYEVIKNNDVKLNGVTILYPGENISPTIYIESFIEEEISAYEIAEKIVDTFLDARENMPKFNPERLKSIREIFDKICLRLINKETNKELLKTIPHKDFLDLAVILTIELGNGMSIKVNHQILKEWNKTIDDLYEIAKSNTRRLFPANIKNMVEIMAEMIGMPVEMIESMVGNRIEQYVLMNESRINGATCLLYDNILKDFANMIGSDIIILPSSIHEVILQPVTPEVTLDDLSKMVTEINMEQVPTEDILSSHAYIYRRETGKIEY